MLSPGACVPLSREGRDGVGGWGAAGHCPDHSRNDDSCSHLSQGQAPAGNSHRVMCVCALDTNCAARMAMPAVRQLLLRHWLVGTFMLVKSLWFTQWEEQMC